MEKKWLFTSVMLGFVVSVFHFPSAYARDEARTETAATSETAASRSWTRPTLALADGWRFQFGDDRTADNVVEGFDDGAWQVVSVPHTWNRLGEYAPETGIQRSGPAVDKRQGVAWYRLRFVAPSLKPGQRAWLQFDAASRIADVWLNGKKLGSHAGGFSRFRFDATALLNGAGASNVLAVRVDSSQPKFGGPTADVLPLTGDFFVYGGLYRPAALVVTNASHFDMLDDGGPGVYAETTAISGKTASLSITARVANDAKALGNYAVVTRLVDAGGHTVAGAATKVAIPGTRVQEIKQTFKVPNAQLWQGTTSPYLYRLVTELRGRDEVVVDRIEQDFGIRQVRFDPAAGLLLNGVATPVRGVGLHQGMLDTGWAMRESDIERAVSIIGDMGANAIRLSHYQHGESIHRLADRYGFLLWDEIPLVTDWTLGDNQVRETAGLARNAHQQLRELIKQNRNHPSVVTWGIANEVDFGPNRPVFLRQASVVPDPAPLLRELAGQARTLDPLRPTTLATCCEREQMRDVPEVSNITQIAGANRYYGWYFGAVDELGPRIDDLHAKRPLQPLSVSEYGAGGAISIHTDNPLGGRPNAAGRAQPEEFQTWLHEKSWPALAARRYLWGAFLWNSFDFAAAGRREGDGIDLNTKGLVTFDGAVRKDAYYFYRANWSTRPTVYIGGRRYVDRAYSVTDVRVYSNAMRTTLTLNGRPLPAMTNCPERVCVWKDVRLDAGANHLAAQGEFPAEVARDAVDWNVAQAVHETFRIDSGTLVAALAASARFGSDNFFEGGESVSMDKFQFFGPPELAQISGSGDREVVATYRTGTFSYRVPVLPGAYRVTLHFVEPSLAPGERVFDVVANGRVALPAMDVAAVAGVPLTAIAKSFVVDAKDHLLELEFRPIKDKAIVSAITVEPIP